MTLATELGLQGQRKLAHSTGLAEEASPALGGFLSFVCPLWAGCFSYPLCDSGGGGGDSDWHWARVGAHRALILSKA